MNGRLVFAAIVYFIFAPWCGDQADKPLRADLGQMNEAPLKVIIKRASTPGAAYGYADQPFSLLFAIHLEQDGSFIKSNIKLLNPSGDRLAEQTGQEILWLLSQSHLLGPLYGLSSTSVIIEFDEKNLSLRITGFSRNQSEAAAKIDHLTQLMDVTRKAGKDSEISESLRRLKASYVNERVEIEWIIPRAGPPK